MLLGSFNANRREPLYELPGVLKFITMIPHLVSKLSLWSKRFKRKAQCMGSVAESLEFCWNESKARVFANSAV
jgi:hypothetical protein